MYVFYERTFYMILSRYMWLLMGLGAPLSAANNQGQLSVSGMCAHHQELYRQSQRELQDKTHLLEKEALRGEIAELKLANALLKMKGLKRAREEDADRIERCRSDKRRYREQCNRLKQENADLRRQMNGEESKADEGEGPLAAEHEARRHR
jgi:TolA-binding protein